MSQFFLKVFAGIVIQWSARSSERTASGLQASFQNYFKIHLISITQKQQMKEKENVKYYISTKYLIPNHT